MKKILLACAVVGLLCLPLSRGASAAELYTPASQSTTINQNVKNLYTAGGTINIDTGVEGDAIIAGNSININQDVEQTLMAVGQSVVVKGNVGQNARLAGNTITINGNIGQDLLVGAATLAIEDGSQVGGDLLAGVAELTVDGVIKGYLKSSANKAVINGTVWGDVTFKDVNQLTIGEKAIVNGKLSYRSDAEATIAAGAQIKGGVDFNQRTPYRNAWVRFLMLNVLTLAMLGKLVAGFLVLLVLIYALPNISQNIVAKTTEKFLTRLGIGFLVLVVVPIVLILLFVSLIGSAIASLVGIWYLLMLILAAHYATLTVGKITRRLLSKQHNAPLDWITALVGIVASAIIALVPALGPLVIFVIFLAALGAITQMLIVHRQAA